MAMRDTWHRTLVYFGLAEDAEYDDYDDYDEPAAPVRAREPEPVRRLPQSRRRRDDYDDIFSDDRDEHRTSVLRPVGRNGGGGGRGDDVRVHFVAPANFNDVQDVGDKFKDQIPVIINLQNSDNDLKRRVIDFSSGLTYALGGGMQKIAETVFLLTPENVQVSAEERARLIEKGFFNQS
jgi:cell division inhibitor SepF